MCPYPLNLGWLTLANGDIGTRASAVLTKGCTLACLLLWGPTSWFYVKQPKLAYCMKKGHTAQLTAEAQPLGSPWVHD